MGWGDEVIATGQARLLHEKHSRPVVVRGRDGQPRWHAIFDGNPKLTMKAGGNAVWLDNWSGNRPYIAGFTAERWTWKRFACPAGEIHLTEEERAYGAARAGHVVIVPGIKPRASPNKQWHGWQALVDALPGVPWLQLWDGNATIPPLERVRVEPCPSYRHAAAVLACSTAVVTPEGGMHHAAAAFRTPAVVIFGGFISPLQTGYGFQRNLFTGGDPCGMRVPCDHCRGAMAKISVAMVAAELEQLLSH